MQFLHITRSAWKRMRWSGGTTDELLLWPPESGYAARTFSFRLSSATVADKESTFTLLPEVERWITPLSGGFALDFGAHGRVALGPYDCACFDGGWDTRCIGQARDFNLMLRGCSGSLQALHGPSELALEGGQVGCLFFPEGGFARQGETLYNADRDDLLVFFAEAEERLTLSVQATVALYAAIAFDHDRGEPSCP